jgi:hypothetical protein
MYWLASIGMLFLGILLLRLIAASDLDRSKRASISSLRSMFKENGLTTAVKGDYLLISKNNETPLRMYTRGLGSSTSWLTLSGNLDSIEAAEVVLTLSTLFLLDAIIGGELQLKFPPPTPDADYVHSTLIASVSELGFGEHAVEEISGVFIHLEVVSGALSATVRRIRNPASFSTLSG